MHQAEALSPLETQGHHNLKSRQPLNPGVILLTARQELLYITPTAQRILRHLDRAAGSLPQTDRLPPIVQDLCEMVEQARRRCLSSMEWTSIQIHRTTLTAHHQIGLGGFILPEWTTPPSHRLLIVLELLTLHTLPNGDGAAPLPLLTARQESVARGLMRGLTNKEMAVELQLSVHTVKEYVRAIMTKYEATTRAGVAACLASSSQSASRTHETERAARPRKKPA
jgi:DNA-binding CsgD family transcriptional regulator